MISEELLDIIVCPETKQSLKIADKETVDQINNSIELKSLKNKTGQIVEDKIQAGLVVEDKSLLYPIREDIPILLPEESISLDQLNK